MRNAIVAVMDKKGRDGNFSDIYQEFTENLLCRPKNDQELTERLSYVLSSYVTGKEKITLMGRQH